MKKPLSTRTCVAAAVHGPPVVQDIAVGFGAPVQSACGEGFCLLSLAWFVLGETTAQLVLQPQHYHYRHGVYNTSWYTHTIHV